MQEFLVLVVIALAVFYLPRILGRSPVPVPEKLPPALTGRMRLAVLITVFWVAALAIFLEPWNSRGGDAQLFFSAGLGPVIALWGAAWVWSGYKRYRR